MYYNIYVFVARGREPGCGHRQLRLEKSQQTSPQGQNCGLWAQHTGVY